MDQNTAYLPISARHAEDCITYKILKLKEKGPQLGSEEYFLNYTYLAFPDIQFNVQ